MWARVYEEQVSGNDRATLQQIINGKEIVKTNLIKSCESLNMLCLISRVL